MIIGYRIPGSSSGGVFTVSDDCWGKVSEGNANRIAEGLRSAAGGKEPSWQTVRGKLIRLAKTKSKTVA
jgi:hypothetical protein